MSKNFKTVQNAPVQFGDRFLDQIGPCTFLAFENFFGSKENARTMEVRKT